MDIDISSHLTSDELALLAEGNAGEAADGFRRHLAHCRSCYQAYEDAVEARARWLVGREAPASPELIQAGRLKVGRASGGRVTRAPRLRIAAITVGVLGMFVAGVLFWASRGPGRDEIARRDLMAAAASPTGPLNPGESEGKIDEQPFRSGAAPLPRGTQAMVDSLRALYGKRQATDDDLFWLVIAQLGSDNLPAARLYLREANKDDPRFSKLEGILDYRESRLAEAEEDFRSALKKYPDDPEIELNLGLVLAETGQLSEARSMLLKARESKVPKIVQRADALLDSLGSR